jgi:hypothetical protein
MLAEQKAVAHFQDEIVACAGLICYGIEEAQPLGFETMGGQSGVPFTGLAPRVPTCVHSCQLEVIVGWSVLLRKHGG